MPPTLQVTTCMWAAVLDNDAFEAFEEAGNVRRPTAKRPHDYIYSAGSSIESADAYRAFRGRDAKVEAMLRKRVGGDGVIARSPFVANT